MVFSDAPSFVPPPSEPEIEAAAVADSLTLAASDLHDLEVRVTEAAKSPASDI